MTDLQRNQLYKIVGLERSLEGVNFTINKVIPGQGMVTLKCSDHNRNLNDDEIDSFINALGEPVPKSVAVPVNAAPGSVLPVQGYSPTAENVEMKNILMDTLRGIKSGEVQVVQGKAIFDGVHAMVAVQKTELEMMRMSNKKRF